MTIAHAEAVAGLDTRHRDPFDRMLIAQATVEHAVIMSNDEALSASGVATVW